MNKVISQFICGLLFVSQFISLAEAKRPEIIELDHIVAVVNKEVITALELQDREKTVLRRLRAQNTALPPEAVLRKQILEQMIMSQIQLQLAYKSGIRVSDEQLNRMIEEIAANNKMSLDEFRAQLQTEGYNFARFREEIRNDVIIKQLRKRQIENKIFVTEQEVNAELSNLGKRQNLDNEYRLGHILIPVSESAKPEELAAAKQKADEVIGQLMLGRDFSEMAISVSAGQRALQGGDLGWLKEGQIPRIATKIVTAMEAGQISDPIRSSSGFHILKLLDKRSSQTKHIVEQTRARHILIIPKPITCSHNYFC